MKIYRVNKFVLLIFVLTYSLNAQINCGLCSSTNQTFGYNFTCYGKNCDTFQLPHMNQTQAPGFNGACKQPKYPWTLNCYYKVQSSIPYDTYNACNFTMPGCSLCNNSQTCDFCYLGYFQYTPNIDLPNPPIKCRKCSEAILGCITCASQYNCTLCQEPYLLINGSCFQRDGKTIPGGKTVQPTDFQLDSISNTLIAVAVLNGLGILILGVIAFYIFRNKNKNYNPLLQNQN